jgi:thiosulfate reductase cytochrome b subunit
MNDTSRKQGWAITGTAVFLGLLFLAGLLNGSYVALAVPVAVLTFFVLGLVAWVGHTIATVEVEAETPAPEASPTAPTTESARGTDGE